MLPAICTATVSVKPRAGLLHCLQARETFCDRWNTHKTSSQEYRHSIQLVDWYNTSECQSNTSHSLSSLLVYSKPFRPTSFTPKPCSYVSNGARNRQVDGTDKLQPYTNHSSHESYALQTKRSTTTSMCNISSVKHTNWNSAHQLKQSSLKPHPQTYRLPSLLGIKVLHRSTLGLFQRCHRYNQRKHK